MNKLYFAGSMVVTLLFSLFPCLVLADNSLSFTPPASDYSVVFLGNLFGIVDGVLSGTGSQIMGTMFGVFNAAVLALGGIIIMYTLMVSTMNTAHEGQMLGQKWSSIWIPVRSTLGLTLLIPKASGYCLMQIFVMWIVVQGIGAADKVWDAALSYLNRGGVIIQAQQINPAEALTNTASNSGIASIATGAINILSGQVCMLGLQTQLQKQRQTYLNAQQKNSGPCASPTQGSPMYTFCTTSVPDFISTVNVVSVQNNNPTASSFSVPMPNFDTGSPYNVLNGICGNINWNSISTLNPVLGTAVNPGSGSNINIGGTQLNSAELSATQMSRAIAIQQMYVDLSTVTQNIITNDPQMSTNSSNNTTTPYSLVANQQFGVPYTQNSTVCTSYSLNCVIWGAASGSSGGGVMFSGREFVNALNDYNGVMMPTINLVRQISQAANSKNEKEFISKASTQGWIMAGAYFYNLVKIQGSATEHAAQTDINTGLDKSTFDSGVMMSAFNCPGQSSTCNCTGQYATLCTWFNQDNTAVGQVEALITGTGITRSNGTVDSNAAIPKPSFSANTKIVDSTPSSTVYGFINNSLMMQTPGQPGLKPLTFSNTINFSVDTSLYKLQSQNFDCGKVKIVFFSFCLGQMMGNLFYNYIFLYIYNFFLQVFGQLINQVVIAFLLVPLTGMSEIFKQGVKTISEPGVNPVVALANMGVNYINFSGNLWIMLLDMAVTSALIPIFGLFIFALMTLALPLLIAWVGVMVMIGFTTAYYIPILPYMIFTFGAIGWLISVIEAMVAAPIVALGVTHPEGHDAFGKGEAAIMILINVFLRPPMMIIGYIAAIALSYVGVWILNAGFDQAIGFIQQETNSSDPYAFIDIGASKGVSGGYTDWAGIYAFFFSILAYTTMYLIIVQKAFTLISYLPDKVLRWIGGNPESLGQETAQWGEEVKSSGKDAGKATQDATGQIDKQLGGYAMKGLGKGQSAMGKLGGSGKASAEGGSASSTPEAPPGASK